MSFFIVRIGLLVATAVALPTQAAPTNEDEASMGAAAVIVLAQKCDGNRVAYYQTEAKKTLQYILQRYSNEAQARVFDNLPMKIKALHISSSGDSCAGASRLNSMATHWGYEYLVKSMQSSTTR